MFLSCWLTSVRSLFSQRRLRGGRRPAIRWRRGDAGRHLEQLEARQVMAFDFVSAYPNVGAFITEGSVLDQAPQQITIKFSPGSKVDPQSLSTGIVVTRSMDGTFGNGDDKVVTPGSITVDDFPNQNMVVVRFAETLPDDSYRITISGAGAGGLRTLAQGSGLPSERFRGGDTFTVGFRLDLGAQVVSVVPQPVIRPKLINFGADIAQYKDGDLLDVAIRGGRIAFEFDTDGKVAAGRRAVTLAGKSAADLAGEVAAAISSSGVFGTELDAATVPSATPTRINLRGANFTPVVSFTRAGAVPAIAPVAIVDGPTLTQAVDKVAVYFNANDPLTQSSAQNPRNYQLVETDPATGAAIGVQVPKTVSYDAVSGTALLTFDSGKIVADRFYRLQVGSSTDENNLISKALNVGTLFSTTPYSIDSFLGDGAEGVNDVDLHRFSLTAAGTIDVQIVPDSALAPLLRLFDATGAEVAASTAGSAGVAGTLSFAAPAAGIFYLGVSSVGNNAYLPATGGGAAGGTTRGGYRLTIGSSVGVAASDENSSFSTATNLGAIGLAGQTLSGVIDVRPTVATPAGDLLFPSQPGTTDEPGHREIPVEGESHGMPDSYVDPASGMTVMFYNFRDFYGTDPQGNQLHNAITEEQKQRAREVFTLFSLHAGIRFVESADRGLVVATGDVRAIAPGAPPTALLGICGPSLSIMRKAVVMNSTVDWGQSEHGGSWYATALHEIGHSIGLGHAYDIPSVMGAGESGAQQIGENILVTPYDFDHIRVLYPKTGSDIDVYKFTLDTAGSFSAQTIVARQGEAAKSELDTVLTLYREVAGVRTLVARNDDYYGRDSFVGLDLGAGTYYLAVTSTGNDDFNPEVSVSGYGGRSDGAYDLRIEFTPVSEAINTIVDATGTALDGDRDGKVGGAFDAWFSTASAANTIWVDKAAAASGANGTIAKPFTTIAAALAAVTPSTRIIRIVGNTGNDASLVDDKAYLVGTTLAGKPLADGATFNVPKGVAVMIDQGAAFKLRAAIIDVGSSSKLVSRAGAALQVLGTPGAKVQFTSYHDDSIGGNDDGVGPAVQGGQWGGIVLRRDSDSATHAAFVNSISQAVLKYGGGNVLVDSQLQPFSPIHIESTRPTIAFNEILASAGAAISADPNAFEDSNGRYGPEFRGNRLLANTINGLFVRIRTEFGSVIDKLDVPARFKSTDITYVIQENLVLAGGAGGYLLNESTGTPEARATGRLVIDPGVVVKLQGARIELERGNARLIAEGTADQRVIFTSLGDVRYGAGGTFDTNGNAPDVRAAGDWSGIVIQIGSGASIDNAYVAYGGGQSAIEGGFDRFDVIEVQQGDLRLANSRIEFNASGRSSTNRNARGSNDDSTVFVRDAVPIIVGNDFRDNSGATISVNANSMSDVSTPDIGRSTGPVARYTQYDDNVGPLLRDNAISNKINYASDRQKGSFDIALEFGAGVTQAIKDAMRAAADRWETIITGDLSSVKEGTLVIDDILVSVQAGLLGGSPSDGAGNVLANANPTAYRADTDVNRYLPYRASVGVDMNDASSGQLVAVLAHELGHALGFTSVSQMLNLATGARYVGANALREYRNTFDAKATFVPLESGGGAGTAYAHWDDATFDSELLTGYINPGINPLTRLTVGAFQDMGYSVNYSAADDYLPKSGTVGYAQPVSGVLVRGEQILVNGVWDDTDLVHVVTSEITVDNFHTATSLRLQSQSNASLVVKLAGPTAGFTATGTPGEIDDRIGGTVQVVGQPGYPVVLTSLYDDTVGASLDPLGRTVTDTNNDGRAWIDATATAPVKGSWRSLKFLPLSNDTNVAILREAELPYTHRVDVNNEPSAAQVIGVLAPNFATGGASTESAQNKGGDENRRDGFAVRGAIATDNPGDVDVYSFAGYAGSEVWIDIDKTTSSLDTMLELLDAAGTVLARSVDGQFDTGSVVEETVVSGAAAAVQQHALAHGNILPGTLSGSIYLGNTIVQTFTVSRAGAFTFTNIGTPAKRVTSATLDRDTGVVTLTWNGSVAAGGSRLIADYSFGNLSLATLGYTVTGENGALPLAKDAYRGNDYFTTNPRDAGMRVVLPGVAGGLNQYFIRVRSQPNVAPTATRTAYEGALTSAAGLASGTTSGGYELNVRLQQRDQVPGSTVAFADIRYATTGIDVQGLPRNSLLAGTVGQMNVASNTTFLAAQDIGKLLQSDQNTISLAGNVATSNDVKWFKFSVDYSGIQAIGGINGGGKTWATVLDIDYADGFRGDLTMAVFDSAGKLIYMGRDSNVAADQPAAGQGNDFDDLSRGSIGKLDPYIGGIQLPAGATTENPTMYYVAIMSNATLPAALDATFKSGATNALVRLEPVDSVTRVVEDHIGSTGYTSNGADVAPTQGALINVGSAQQLAANVRAFNLADVPLFVSSSGGVYTANALTGRVVTTLQENGYYGDGSIGDLDMLTNGKLMQYFGQNGDDANVGHLRQIDTGTGAILSDAGDAIPSYPASPQAEDFWKVTSSSVDAVVIGRTGVGAYDNSILYSVRKGTKSQLYWGRTSGNASWNKDDPPYSLRGTIADGTGGTPVDEKDIVGVGTTSVTYQVAGEFVNGSLTGTIKVGGVAAQTFTVSNWGFMTLTTLPGYSGTTASFGSIDTTTGVITLTFPTDPGATTVDVTYRPPTISGLTTGLQFRNENFGTLYGVSSGGQFYTVSTSSAAATLVADFSKELKALGDGTTGFGGLANAPVNLENGRYQGMFFAITNTGRLVCIDVAKKKLLENVFDNDGNGVPEASISRAILGGATGLAFSPLDVNLWHPTTTRGADAGHGINAAPDNSRDSVEGGASMYFGLEKFGASPNYAGFNTSGGAGQYGVVGGTPYNWQEDLTSNPEIGGNYNVPGGTQGSLVTNSFSLAGYVATDKPSLYFNYFLDTEGAQGNASNGLMRDSARVFVSIDNGLTWEVAATNNSLRSSLDTIDAELPNTLSASKAVGKAANQAVQELFDSTGTWRQARVDLAKWAGKSNIQLRFDFATAGMMDATALRTTADEIKKVAAAVAASTTVTLDSVSGLRTGMVVTGPGVTGQPTVSKIEAGNVVTLSAAVTLAAGDSLSFFDVTNDRRINRINGVANTDGNLGSAERGQKNLFEGFYVDDLIVGFAERGEMVTGALGAQTGTFSVATPSGDTYPQQSLQGEYQLEIRRGTEYAVQLDASSKPITIVGTMDTNDSMEQAPSAPAKVLEEHVVDGLDSALIKGGNGRIQWPSAAILAQAGLEAPAGDTFAILDSSSATSQTNNLLAWKVDLATQTKATLEFQYLTLPAQEYKALPPTFTVGADGILPSGDGVAISVDGGTTWKTLAALGNTQGQWSRVRVDLGAAGVTLSANTQIGFFQAGKTQLDIGPTVDLIKAGGIALDDFLITVDPPTVNTGTIGDRNHPRTQGQFVIASNIISDVADYGISITAGDRDFVRGNPNPGTVRNLAVLNNPALVPGAVAMNNVIANAGRAGIRFAGDPGVYGGPNAPVPFGRIVNNTIWGGDSAGTGIEVGANAAPTILNTLFANLATGVVVEGSSTADASGNLRTVIGTSAYWQVDTQVSGTQESSPLVLSGNPFVNAEGGNFYLVAGSEAIDSSINALQDRAEYTAVKSPLAIQQSPVVAPDRDLYGQLRVDNPSQASAPGLGSNVFKDRGAIDRVDFVQPRIAIVVPVDGDPLDRNAEGDAIRLERRDSAGVTQFVLQLDDEGVGIDKSTVVSSAFRLTVDLGDGVKTLLRPGVDYIFRYLQNTNRVIFESIAAFPLGTYTIEAMSRPVTSAAAGWLVDLANNTLLPNKADGTTSFEVSLADIPSAPLSVVGTRGDSQVTLAWQPPASIGGTPIVDYYVQWSTDGGATWTTFDDGKSSSPSATVTGLTNGTSYVFRVQGRNAVNETTGFEDGIWSAASAPVKPLAPASAPGNLLANGGNASATLSWTAPTFLGGSTLSDYRVEYSTNGGTSWTTFAHPASTATSITVTGLTNGVGHVFRVSGVTEYGAGASSTVSLVVVPMTLPDAPNGLTAKVGNTLVSLKWTDGSNGGSTVTSHVISFRVAGSGSWQTFTPAAPVTGTSVDVTGLTNGTAYEFRVASTNAVGTSGFSNIAGPITPVAPASAPLNVIATGGNAQVDLSWAAPSSDGGSPITDYQIQSSLDGGVSWTVVADGVSTATTATIAGLVNGRSYVYRIAAITSYGLGAWSSATGAVIPMTVPTAPTGLTGVRGNASVALSWTAPADTGGVAVTDCEVEYRLTGAATWSTFPHAANGSATAITVTGLTNGSSYEFRLKAVNAAGTSPASNVAGPLVPMTVASAPQRLVGTFGDMKVTLAWAAPASNGGGTISDYLVEYRDAKTVNWITFPRSPSLATAVVVSGLQNGVAYDFRVSAVNPVGKGESAATASPITPMTIPDAPTIVSAKPGDSKVDLVWKAPASDGGGAISNYIIEYRVDNATSVWTRYPRVASAATSATVTGLTNGTTYLFRVTAVNPAGMSVPSAVSESVMPVTVPTVPQDLVAIGGDKVVNLSWKAPASNGGLPITDYVVEYRAGSDAAWKTFADGISAATTASVTGLTNGVTYRFRVTAKNSFGTGLPTAESNPIVVMGLPSAPAAPVATAGAGAVVHLAWKAPADTGGVAILDYVVEYRKTTATAWTVFNHAASPATGILVTGLTTASSYVFRVTAKNALGAGIASAISNAVTVVDVPTAPTAVAGKAGDKLVTLSWTAPSNSNGSPITDYVIEYRKSTEATWTTFADTVSASTTVVVTNLVNGVGYVFRVTAKNGVGSSAVSAESGVVKPLGPAAGPTGVTGTGSRGVVTLKWTPPSDTGGLPITKYVVQYRVNKDGAQWVTATWPAGVPATATTVAVRGFVTRFGHLFRVAAVTSLGQGAWSEIGGPINPWGA